jgi:hypothetical protein
MRGHTWSGISAAIVLAATVGVAAQEPSPSQNSQPAPQPPATSQAPAPAPESPQSPQSNDARRVTVAGCLQAAPSGPVGTSGSAAPAPAPSTPSPAPDAAAKPEGGSESAKLVLVDAVPAPAEAAGNASNSAAPQTYRLIANEGALMPHVGKKLELTGTIEDQKTSASNDSSAANTPQLRVESGKVVASTCMP